LELVSQRLTIRDHLEQQRIIPHQDIKPLFLTFRERGVKQTKIRSCPGVSLQSIDDEAVTELDGVFLITTATLQHIVPRFCHPEINRRFFRLNLLLLRLTSWKGHFFTTASN
jgi:hypothetical protein